MTDETQEQQITAVGNEMSASFLAAKKRSNATLAKLEEHPEKFTMLTGDRPTGRLHLGHYFGSIRERVAMQNRGVNSNIIIADYQVITDRDTTEHIEDNVLNLVLDYMAAGIDPNKTMIFTHSAVPAENQTLHFEESPPDPADAPHSRCGLRSGQGQRQDRHHGQGHRSDLYRQGEPQRHARRRRAERRFPADLCTGQGAPREHSARSGL